MRREAISATLHGLLQQPPKCYPEYLEYLGLGHLIEALLDLCLSSLRPGCAHLLCGAPSLTDGSQRESIYQSFLLVAYLSMILDVVIYTVKTLTVESLSRSSYPRRREKITFYKAKAFII